MPPQSCIQKSECSLKKKENYQETLKALNTLFDIQLKNAEKTEKGNYMT